MAVVYEDNFGFWNIESPEEEAFFEDVRSRSIPRRCERCECSVRLLPPSTLCARCVSALEFGAPYSMTSSTYGPNVLAAPQEDHSRSGVGVDIPKPRRKR